MINRELVAVEQAMEILNRRAGSLNVVTISRIKGPLSEDIVRQALDLVQCRHPRLNCRIVGSLDSLRFEAGGIQKIPLRVVNNIRNDQWQEIVREELNEKIDSSKCLLRAVLVPAERENGVNYLITTVHHAISDALSCTQMHSEILTFCHKVASGVPIAQVSSLFELPSLEELLPKFMTGFRSKIRCLLFLLRLNFKRLWNQPATLGFEKYVPIELRRCGLVHRQIDEELTQEFVNLCKQKKTTVHGALCAAMLFAAATRITAFQKRNIRVSCESYIDVRRRLKPAVSNENMSVLASSLSSFHTLQTNTSFWDLAQDVRRQVDAGLERGDMFNVMLMSRKISEFFLSHPDTVPGTVAVSNIGRVNIPKVYGLFELEEISYVPSQAMLGGVFGVAVSTFQEKMFLNFMFSEPSISQETMESLANNVLSCIEDACYQENLVFNPDSGDLIPTRIGAFA